jgi:hypothetical protein
VVGAALDALRVAAPLVKQQALDAASHVVFADEVVTVAEGELLRIVAASLDAPLPPFVD